MLTKTENCSVFLEADNKPVIVCWISQIGRMSKYRATSVNNCSDFCFIPYN